MNMKRHRALFCAVFLTPALLLFTLLVAVPAVRALGYSLQKWNGLTAPEWAGLQNFRNVLADNDLFLVALGHNLFLMVTAGSLIIGLSLFFASLVHRRIRGAKVFRVTFFFPNIISAVAIALLWTLLYSTTEFGVINNALALLHRIAGWPASESLPFAFLDSKYLIVSIVPMMVWTLTGFYMVLFLAAMENIPESFYEVARIEGASALAQFRYVTFPLIREVFTVGLVFLVIAILKFFDPIWVMENQRPTRESHVLATVLYQKVFSEYDVGYGSAVAVLLFLLVLTATLVTLRLQRREALEY